MIMGPGLVLLRCQLSGVWFGEVMDRDESTITIIGRRIWSWPNGALDCSSLAVYGPTSARITCETEVTLRLSDCIEIHVATAEAAAAIRAIKAER